MTPRLRQSKLTHSAGGSGFGTTFTLTFDSAVVAGNVIAIMIGIGNIIDEGLITSVADNLGNTYTKQDGNIDGGDTKQSYVAPVTTGGTCTITVTTTTDQGWRNITAQEIVGVSSTVLSHRVNFVTSTADEGTNAGAAVKPSMDGCYFFGAMYWDNVNTITINPGSRFTMADEFEGDGSGAPCAHEWLICNPRIPENVRFSLPGGGNTTVFEIVLAPLEAVPGIGKGAGEARELRPYLALLQGEDEGRFDELDVRNWFE